MPEVKLPDAGITFDSILYVCSTADINTYDEDLGTVLGLMEIIGDYDFLFATHDYETFMKVFVEGEALQRIEEELAKNGQRQYTQKGLKIQFISYLPPSFCKNMAFFL